jgi:transposase
MNGGGVPMQLHTIGIDLGKTVFHLVGLNLCGEVLVRKKFSRKQLLHFTANLQVELIGMEACGGSHFLGRALREQGHEVRLMPAQYVKPYVKTNKSDYIDAEDACFRQLSFAVSGKFGQSNGVSTKSLQHLLRGV